MTHSASPRGSRPRGELLRAMAGLLVGVATTAYGQPEFSKVFEPNTIGPGSSSRLRFSIDNTGGLTATTDLAFTDILPAGVTLATPAQPSTDCTDGTVVAPDGGGTVTFSGGRLGAGAACTVTVDVTSGTAGSHTNVSGDLTSSAGNSGTATDDLTVDADRPGFTQAFTPPAVATGDVSTLVYTVDNSSGTSDAISLSFTDQLPDGIEFADPPLAGSTCTELLFQLPTLTIDRESRTLTTFGYVANAASSCTFTVNVTPAIPGTKLNTSSELTSFQGPSGFSSARLDVESAFLQKEFVDDPVSPGDTATLTYTLTHTDRSDAATAIAFEDDLEAALAGLVAVEPLPTEPCGAGSTLTGTSTLGLSGGTLSPGSSCSFSVDVQVPSGATAGVYPSTTGPVTADVGGLGRTFPTANDVLVVGAAPRLEKLFVDDPVTAGDTVTLRYTLTNPSTTSSATDVEFEDDLGPMGLGFAIALPPFGFCGPTSSGTFTDLQTQAMSFIGAELGPTESCEFDVQLTLPTHTLSGDYPSTTGPVTATVDGLRTESAPATDTLTVVSAPSLRASFTDPVLAGETTTLELTLIAEEGGTDVTALGLTVDLDATLGGLSATGLPTSDVCGSGSQLSGTSVVTFESGSLTAGESCTFGVTVDVPVSASPGTYPLTTSPVEGQADGQAVSSAAATTELIVTGLELTLDFVEGPVPPGDLVTLRFTLDNPSTLRAESIQLGNDLSSTLLGLDVVEPLPATPCGPDSVLTDLGVLFLIGGRVDAGTSCSFDVLLDVPATAEPGDYPNAVSSLVATFDGEAATLPGGHTVLTLRDALALGKTFQEGPVATGGTTELTFTVDNLDPTRTATDLTFTDDLESSLPGLTAVGLPESDVCGSGSLLSGASLVTLTGGRLAPGASCTFSVTLQVPADTPTGTLALNTTSEVTGSLDGLSVRGPSAQDSLLIDAMAFDKVFTRQPTTAGGTPELTFTLRNEDALSASDLTFSDDLDAVLPGLAATGLPASDVCGEGSLLTGTSMLTLARGVLGPGESCTFTVGLQVPESATPGTFVNTTAVLERLGRAVASPARATLRLTDGTSFSVDAWTDAQAPLAAPPTSASSVTAVGGSVFGDERDLELSLVEGAGPVTAEVVGGALVLDVPAGDRARLVVSWDGVDGSPTLQPTSPGLADADLTATDLFDGLALGLVDVPANVELILTVLSGDGADASRAAAVASGAGTAPLAYSDLVASQGAGADLTAIDAIQLEILVTGSDADTPISLGPLELSAPAVAATMEALDGSGQPLAAVAPGEIIRYAVTVTGAAGEANDVRLENDLDLATLTPGSVSITPLARDDQLVATIDAPLVVPAPGLLDNDVDFDGGNVAVTTTSASTLQGGSVTLQSDGALTYLPPPGFSGVDTFVYTIVDDESDPAEGTVVVIVE